MNSVKGHETLKNTRDYHNSKTKYWPYEIDVTSNKLQYYLRILWKEYIVPKLIFKHAILVWNHPDWISNYILDLSILGINNGIKIIRPTPEYLIVSTLSSITEYIQINVKSTNKITNLMSSINNLVELVINNRD
jgi:hypothetical protein